VLTISCFHLAVCAPCPQAALPLRRSTYEERWQALESWPTGKPITYQDVPWPCPVPGSQAAARKQQQQQHALVLDPKQLQTLVLAGAYNAACLMLACEAVQQEAPRLQLWCLCSHACLLCGLDLNPASSTLATYMHVQELQRT
jgi:hypothetical protein